MSKRKDITNQKFGRLTAIMLDKEKSNKNRSYWLCQCDCDKTKLISVYLYQLTSGKTVSCGCYRTKLAKRIKHGDTANNETSKLYISWDGMIQRVSNPKNTRYKDYGGRGIKIEQSWYDYLTFKNWSLKNGYKDNLTIERIDVNGNYEPNNCTWIEISEQAKNKRNTVYITYYDKTYRLLDLLDLLLFKGLIKNKKYIYTRIIDLKWNAEDAIDIPLKMRKSEYYFLKALINEFSNKYIGHKIIKKEFINKYNIKPDHLRHYLRKQNTIEILNNIGVKNNKFYLIKTYISKINNINEIIIPKINNINIQRIRSN